MPTPKICILRAPGTNCDEETAFAFERAGGEATRVHLNELTAQPSLLIEYQILCIPGGFSFGDDVGAGVLFASELKAAVGEIMQDFLAKDTLILGICNGFQVLMKTGLLPTGREGWTAPITNRPVTLTWNTSGRYDARWVHLQTVSEDNVFLRGVETIELPVAHAEGRIAVDASVDIQDWHRAGQIGMVYRESPVSRPFAPDEPTLPEPANPNGSVANIAGLSDPGGRILGLMPHPERAIDATQHPQWTRRDLPPEGDGMKLFRNAITYFA